MSPTALKTAATQAHPAARKNCRSISQTPMAARIIDVNRNPRSKLMSPCRTMPEQDSAHHELKGKPNHLLAQQGDEQKLNRIVQEEPEEAVQIPRDKPRQAHDQARSRSARISRWLVWGKRSKAAV